MNAELLMLTCSVAAFLLTIHWVRSRDLRERFAIWWLLISALLLVPGLMPDLIVRLAATANLSSPALILFIALAVIYTFSFFVCVSLTDQRRRTNRLTQQLALLQHRLEKYENRAGDRAPVEARILPIADQLQRKRAA